MSFYNSIASYYDYIFPAYEAQVEFLKENIGMPPKQILDIACGTGSYALALAKLGYSMTALDADKGMIDSASEKAELEGLDLALIECYMENIKDCIEGHFDGAYCIGNSLVHLNTNEQISQFLKDIYEILNKGSRFVIQIINYDRIIKHKVTELPPIKNDEVGLEFARNYHISEDQKQVAFNTCFKIEDKVEEHTTMLLPLFKEELEKMLKTADFKIVKCCGDFKGSSFEASESYHCIFVVEK